MPDDKILDRVRKLLELAHSDNVNEAGNAAARAQELMSRHNISEAMLTPAGAPEEQPEEDLLFVAGAYQRWRGSLAVVMGEANQCLVFRTGPALRIVGRPSDVQTVRYLFVYVVREIERLCKFDADLRGNPGKTWCNNYKHGASNEVARRLRESAREARAAMRREADAGDTLGSGTALVLVNNALAKLDARGAAVEAWRVKLELKKAKSYSSALDETARLAGQRAGKSIDLSNAKGALGSGSRKGLRP